MNVIAPWGFLASLATNQPVPTPAGGEMPDPSIDGNGKNPTSNSWRAWTISDTSHVPVGFMAATGIEQGVSTVVGEGVWALRVVSVLHEVPEEEVDCLLDLGSIPPTVSIENVIQPFPIKHVAGPHAEHMTCGVLFPVSKGERDLSASLELVRDLS